MSSGSTTVRPRGRYHRRSVFALLASGAVPGLDVVDPVAQTLTRAVRTPAGVSTTRLTFEPHQVRVDADTTDPAVLDQLVAVVRQWLDFDTDLAAVTTLFGPDPVLGPLLRARPGLRLFGHPDPFECAVVTVLGQQVSLGAARTFAGRLVAGYRETGLFPSARRLARIEPADFQATVGVTHSRARTVLALATAFADGAVDLDAAGDHARSRRQLLALPGIGPWTTEYLALRVLGDADAFPSGDLVLRRAMGVSSAADADRAALGWRPLRGYALFHLWAAAAYDRVG